MTLSTQQMAADTVMCLRQLEAALRIMLVQDWANVRHLACDPLPPGTRRPDLTPLFFGEDEGSQAPYGSWLQQHFGTWPDGLLRTAVSQTGFDLRLFGKLNGQDEPPSIQQALIMTTRTGELRLYVEPRRSGDLVKEIAPARMQLRLYHKSSKTWSWRKVARDGWPVEESFFIEDGETLTEVSPALAEFIGASMGCWIDLTNRNELALDPVLAIFPDCGLNDQSGAWRS